MKVSYLQLQSGPVLPLCEGNSFTYDFSMKALLFRSLIAALLIGQVIGFVVYATSIEKAMKYEPPVSGDEMDRMQQLPLRDVQAELHRRAVPMTRWEWLKESIHYAYFWKDVAAKSVVPSVGVFIACIWVGWLERRGALRIQRESSLPY